MDRNGKPRSEITRALSAYVLLLFCNLLLPRVTGLGRFSKKIIPQIEAMGYVACSLLASYSAYEILFKFSFPILEPTLDRITYLITFDLYPLMYLSASLLTFLITRNSWSWNRLFSANLLIVILLWLLWWATSFPLKIWEYEKTPDMLPLILNILTKASTSMLFVTVFKSRRFG